MLQILFEIKSTGGKKTRKSFLLFFLLSRSAVEGMDGSERKEKNERQQGAAERKGERQWCRGKKGRGRRYRTNRRHC